MMLFMYEINSNNKIFNSSNTWRNIATFEFIMNKKIYVRDSKLHGVEVARALADQRHMKPTENVTLQNSFH
jgi:hypothetical protein